MTFNTFAGAGKLAQCVSRHNHIGNLTSWDAELYLLCLPAARAKRIFLLSSLKLFLSDRRFGNQPGDGNKHEDRDAAGFFRLEKSALNRSRFICGGG